MQEPRLYMYSEKRLATWLFGLSSISDLPINCCTCHTYDVLTYRVTQIGHPYSNPLSHAQFLNYPLQIFRQHRKYTGIFFHPGFSKICNIRLTRDKNVQYVFPQHTSVFLICNVAAQCIDLLLVKLLYLTFSDAS